MRKLKLIHLSNSGQSNFFSMFLCITCKQQVQHDGSTWLVYRESRNTDIIYQSILCLKTVSLFLNPDGFKQAKASQVLPSVPTHYLKENRDQVDVPDDNIYPSSFAAHHLNFFRKQIAPSTSKECFVPQSIRRMFYRPIILNYLCSDREQGVHS